MSDQKLDDNPLWDANDTAKFLKVSRSWVYHQAQAGSLPSLKIGGLRRFDPTAIKAFARGEGLKSGRVVVFPVR